MHENIYILGEQESRREIDRETVLHSILDLANSGLDMDQITLNACLYNPRPITDRWRWVVCARMPPLCYLYLPVLHLYGGREGRGRLTAYHMLKWKSFSVPEM